MCDAKPITTTGLATIDADLTTSALVSHSLTSLRYNAYGMTDPTLTLVTLIPMLIGCAALIINAVVSYRPDIEKMKEESRLRHGLLQKLKILSVSESEMTQVRD